LVSVATLGIACGARTTLDSLEPSQDAAVDHRDGGVITDVVTPEADVSARDASPDIATHDVVDECAPFGAACTVNSDCCDFQCGFDSTCGGVAPPYGSTPPPDAP
jgi:hypothetical protein